MPPSTPPLGPDVQSPALRARSRAAASGFATAAEARAIAASLTRSASRPPTSWARRGPVSSESGITTAAPASSMNRALAAWWSAVAYGIGDEDRRPAGRGDLEDRAAGAGDDEVAREQRLTEAPVCSRAGRSGRPGTADRRIALAGRVQHAEAGAGERLDRGVVDRARPQRASEHEHARLVRPDPEPPARRRAVGRGRRNRTTGDAVARVRPGPRSGTPGTPVAPAARASGSSAPDGCRPPSAPAGPG